MLDQADQKFDERFDVNKPPGQETVNHVAPNGTVESAIRSLPFPGHSEIYSKKDVEKEKELAEIDFYNGKTKQVTTRL